MLAGIPRINVGRETVCPLICSQRCKDRSSRAAGYGRTISTGPRPTFLSETIGRRNFAEHEWMSNDTDPRSGLASAICGAGTLRFEPDAQPEQIVHKLDRCKFLKRWLLRLDSNQQPSG